MLRWFSRERKYPGWFAASLDADALDFAHGVFASAGTSAIDSFGSRPLNGDAQGLQRLAGDLHLEQYQCSTLLRAGEYQLLLVEAPNVPPAELKNAMRWRVKDMIDYHLDDATIDVLDIPPDEAAGSRAHMMYAVCARNDLLQARIKQFQDARVPLSVIDIEETAQRNIASLYEEGPRGVALAYVGAESSLLTISARGELFLARRAEIGLKQLSGQGEALQEGLERVALEMQRTFDHFDRQFRHVALAKVLVAPMPEDIGLAKFLADNVALPVETVDLRQKLAFAGEGPDPAQQWKLFHHFGAALRHEGKAL